MTNTIPCCSCGYGPRTDPTDHSSFCAFRRFYDERDHWRDEEAKERRLERMEGSDAADT